jgi:hypothetical protein
MARSLLVKLTVVRLVTTFPACKKFPKAHYHIHKNLSLELVLRKFNPLQALTFYPYEIQFNTVTYQPIARQRLDKHVPAEADSWYTARC